MDAAGAQLVGGAAQAPAPDAPRELCSSPPPAAESRTVCAPTRLGLSLAQRSGLGLMPAPPRPGVLVLGNPSALGLALRRAGAGVLARMGAPAGPAPARGLPHWDPLKPGRDRVYRGDVYDTAVVKRIYPDEIYSWEHSGTTAALTDLAARDAWEQHAVPPIHLAFSEQGLGSGDSRLHFAIVDGHHRLNAAIDAARRLGQPVGLPAIVTSRWEADARGSLLGYRRMPQASLDPSLPAAWNRTGQPLSIHAPEKVVEGRVWGTPQITLTLPGSSLTLSMQDVADRLNGFKRPNEFLDPAKGSTVQVRISLQDVYGRLDESAKNGDLTLDLRFDGVEPTATDWRNVLQDGRPLQAMFDKRSTQDYPIVQIDVQQRSEPFKTSDR